MRNKKTKNSTEYFSRKLSRREIKGQIGIEYMIVIGFVTFAIMILLITAILYSDRIRDRIRLNQVENFASHLLNSAESVYFAGEPSKTTIRLYLPAGITNLTIEESDYLVITTRTSSGENVRAFKSKVPINGTITTSEGIKKLTLEAKENFLQIS